MERVKIKYLADIEHIEKTGSGDWIDLRCAKDIELKAFEYAEIPLGVAIQLPRGFEALVAPRSSTFKKWGIIQTNGVGVIDETFCGDSDQWCMPVLAMRDTKIEKNDRICQFRILFHQQPLDVQIVEQLGNANRSGFGSTGRK